MGSTPPSRATTSFFQAGAPACTNRCKPAFLQLLPWPAPSQPPLLASKPSPAGLRGQFPSKPSAMHAFANIPNFCSLCSWDAAIGKLWADQPCRQDLSYAGPCTTAGQKAGLCSEGVCKVRHHPLLYHTMVVVFTAGRGDEGCTVPTPAPSQGLYFACRPLVTRTPTAQFHHPIAEHVRRL